MEKELINAASALEDREDRSVSLVEVSADLLKEVRESHLTEQNATSVPINQLASLGQIGLSLFPQITEIAQSLPDGGLFKLANSQITDALQQVKDGNILDALQTLSQDSKPAKIEGIKQLPPELPPFNPAAVAVTAALFQVELDLAEIKDLQKEIFSFLESEKESKIESDVEQLISIITKYKFNTENSLFLSSNHKMANDIQRSAREHIISEQKEIEAILSKKNSFYSISRVKDSMNSLYERFQYYRLSLYTFSLSSLLEIMLSKNYQEEYIQSIKSEIEKMSEKYRENFEKCSGYLETLSGGSIETNLLKGVGKASKLTGDFIAKISGIRNGSVDGFLQNSGEKMETNALEMERDTVSAFAAIQNPGTQIFTTKMAELIRIFNHSSDILFDKNNIYLFFGI